MTSNLEEYFGKFLLKIRALLDLKADNIHTHSVSQITDLTTVSTSNNGLMSVEDYGKLSTIDYYANYIVVDTKLSENSTNPAQSKVIYNSIESLRSLVESYNLQVLNLLENKADVVHSHEIEDVNLLQGELDNKALKKHYHSLNDIGGLGDIVSVGFGVEQVGSLDEVDNPSFSTIYLVPSTDAINDNYFDEYIYVNDGFENIGTTQTDLKSKADVYHSSATTDYGVASDSLYGHVKVETSLKNSVNPVQSKVIKNAIDSINTSLQNLNTIIEGKSTVSFTSNLTSGSKLGTITIDNTSTDLYYETHPTSHSTNMIKDPNKHDNIGTVANDTQSVINTKIDTAIGGKSKVTFTQNLTSGTKVGTINIDGNNIDLYCLNQTVISPATETPLINNRNGSKGSSTKYAREDHQHPNLFSSSTGTSGSAGYVKVLKLTISNTYQDKPISIMFLNRKGKEPSYVYIKFANENTTDPALEYFYYDGNPTVSIRLLKDATSTWSLIIQKSENYDKISIFDIINDNDEIAIGSQNIHLTELTDSMVEPSLVQRELNIPIEKTNIGKVPYAGALGNTTNLINTLIANKTFIGTIPISNVWYNVLSLRHRNGGSDGNKFGMYIKTELSSEGNLVWNKQTNTSTWQGERTLLDSINYQSHINGNNILSSANANTSISDLLNNKSDNGHTHTIANITNLQTTLDGKALLNHNHGYIDKDGILKINNTAQSLKNVVTDGSGKITTENKLVIDSNLSSTSNNPVKNKAIYSALDDKVDKVVGKTLSSNDFTDSLKTRLNNLKPIKIRFGATNNIDSWSIDSWEIEIVQGEKLYVKCVDYDHQPIESGNIIFYINGIYYKYSINQGISSIVIRLGKNEYYVTNVWVFNSSNECIGSGICRIKVI